MKQNKGVTLIALIVTIVVLLILAGTTIAMLTGDNGIIARAAKAKEATDKAASEEEAGLQRTLQEIASRVPSVEGYNDIKKVNSPKLAEGMIPVKWNTSKNVWVVCDENDPTWYNYDSKEWANVMLSDGKYKTGDNVGEGTEIADKDLGSMYVWVPRYAYTISDANNENKINVTFVKGNTNEGVNGEIFTTDESVDTTSTKLVHPGFNLGGSPLTGIWVAKFEASGVDDNGNAVGNASKGSKNQTYGPSTNTIAQSLPNKISWRHISIGECEQRSMEVATKDSFGLKNANSHLIKNSEWGAVAYLCYSDYGSVPQINAAGSLVENPWHTYDLYTGQGPSANGVQDRYEKKDDSNNYNTTNGMLASTTGNTTGVYDMNGGAWEYVAAYINNGNGNLNNGGSYFENQKVKSIYASLWDKYDASQEEKDNRIEIDNQTTLTQSELWDNTNKKIEIQYQNARKRLTQVVFDGMAKHKGIGMNEIATEFAYYTAFKDTNGNYTRGWFKDPSVAAKGGTNQQYLSTWDGDLVRVGHSPVPFVDRGGGFNSGGSAGVFCSDADSGNGISADGFRPVVVV